MNTPSEATRVEHGQPSAPRRLRTVRQLCAEHPACTPGGLRWLLFHRQTNGLERAVRKVGRRVLIDVDRFFVWVDEQQAERKGSPHGPAQAWRCVGTNAPPS